MASYQLSPEQVAELRKVPTRTRDSAVADRVKTVVLLSQGWESSKVAEALLIDELTVRRYFYAFKRLGLVC